MILLSVREVVVDSNEKRGAAVPIGLAAQRQRIGERIDEAITAVLNHGKFILGPEVAELESQLALFCGAKHCITCASGTDALQLILMAEGVSGRDSVFVPAFTFVATAEAVVLSGAIPVFVDVLPNTMNVDPSSLESAIWEAKRRELNPRAVIAVDLFGQPADYASISEIAKSHHLTLIADAAQSFGASLKGQRVGKLATYTATSFYPTKPFGCFGDGGAIFTEDEAKAKLLRCLRVHGLDDRLQSVRLGVNSRLDTIQAAILIQKLTILPRELSSRQANATYYDEQLRDVVQIPSLIPGASSAWAQYTILSKDRDVIAHACRDSGIPTAIHYRVPLHLQAAYRQYPTSPGGLSNSEWLSQRVLSLPMHAYLTQESIQQVTSTIRATIGPLKAN